MADASDVETVRSEVESFPELFAEDHRLVEIPDAVAAEHGTHESGETLFVARVTDEDATSVELTDVYRVSQRAGASDSLYFVAKHWSDARFARENVRFC
jgi:hypothetical protein